MSDHKHPNYMAIFYVLIVLTVAELAAALTLKGPDWKAILIVTLVALAFVKAGLVGAYFMHLKFETKTFIGIVCFPLILAVVLVVALFPDVGWMHAGKHHKHPEPTAAAPVGQPPAGQPPAGQPPAGQ